MDLMHYSDVPVVLDRTRVYDQGSRRAGCYTKPVGLWVSVPGEDDWPSCCEAEEFRPGGLIFSHRVTLTGAANVLTLTTVDGLRSFTEQFGVSDGPNWNGIAWPAVVARYDGIIIAPYQWSCRLKLSWYYSWDCASGCIWNLDAIADLVPADGVVA